ncbi:MAG: hypothetical protein AB8H86_03755 [Polyangiales bacterium]
MRLFAALTLALAGCGGTTPTPEYPSPPSEEARALCDPGAPVAHTTLRLEPAHLVVQHDTCAGVVRVELAYESGIHVGDTWLVPTDRIVQASQRETERALPLVAAWVMEDSDLGALRPLTGGWLYNPGAAASPNTFVATDLNAAPILERIQAVYGEPARPVFVVPAWDGEQGERPWMMAAFDEDPNVFGPALLRAYLGPGDAWLDGFATFLWQYIQMREGSLTMDEYLESWLADYRLHRRVDGLPHRQSALAARVKSLCMLPRLRDAATRTIQHRLPEREPLWLDERGVLDVRECLSAVGFQLAMLRYEDATPEALLRVRSAPGNPPVVERGGSFFQSGDVIIEVNRRRVRTRRDVAWALRDVDTGERFVIVVQRGEREARTWARRPRVRDRDAAGFALIPIEVDEP